MLRAFGLLVLLSGLLPDVVQAQSVIRTSFRTDNGYPGANQGAALKACTDAQAAGISTGQYLSPVDPGWCVPAAGFTLSGYTYAGAYVSGVIRPAFVKTVYQYTASCPSGQEPNASNGTCQVIPVTPAECMARNIPDEGDTDGRGASNAIFIAGTAPATQCIAGCTLTVDSGGQPYEGINPATGATVMWTEHERSWSGAPCSNNLQTDQDGNPENSFENPATNGDGEWSCNFALGQCADPEGNIHFCTFTGSPGAQTRSVCVPVSGDSDGDGVPNDRDPAPDDPTDGADEGIGDETDNVASGGASCSSAPTCQGDGILCNKLFQEWKTRCEVEKLVAQGTALAAKEAAKAATGAGGACSTAPTCTGDPVGCAAFVEQRKARCALEAGIVVSGSTGSGEQPEWTKPGTGFNAGDGEGSGDAPGVGTATRPGPESLNTDGFLSSHSIPPMPDVDLGQFGAKGKLFSDSGVVSMWEGLVLLFRGLIMVSAMFACARIFAGQPG